MFFTLTMTFAVLILGGVSIFLGRLYKKKFGECLEMRIYIEQVEEQNNLLRRQKAILEVENTMYKGAQMDVVLHVAHSFQREEDPTIVQTPTIH